MNGQPPPPLPPTNKSKFVILLVSVVGIVLLLLLGTIGWLLFLKDDSNNNGDKDKASSKDTSDTKKPGRPEKNKDNDDATDSNADQGETVAWSLPIDPAGWENEIFDEDGVFRYEKTDTGCLINFRQAHGAQSVAASGITLADSLQQSILSPKKQPSMETMTSITQRELVPNGSGI